jgi:hypothetical protein
MSLLLLLLLHLLLLHLLLLLPDHLACLLVLWPVSLQASLQHTPNAHSVSSVCGKAVANYTLSSAAIMQLCKEHSRQHA